MLMNVVDLGAAPDSVRQYILSLNGASTVFELDGQRVACLVPPPAPLGEDGEWTRTKNHRRVYLIGRKIDELISPDEADELEDLTRQMRRYANRVAPVPLAEARKLLEELQSHAAIGSVP